MTGDTVRLLCLHGACTNNTTGFQYCIHNADDDWDSQATPEIFLKHCMWSSEPELPTSPVVDWEGRLRKFLTCMSQGVHGGFLQEFYYCQCCRITCSNLKNVSTLLRIDFHHLLFLFCASPVLQYMLWQVLEMLSSEHLSLVGKLTA